jgi:hypothetical protein
MSSTHAEWVIKTFSACYSFDGLKRVVVTGASKNVIER